MDEYSVPGVYIKESSVLSLSINSSATAIPVFAFEADKPKSTALFVGAVTEISSWLDVAALAAKTLVKDGKPDPEAVKAWQQEPLYLSLKTYFDNGGGRGYVVVLDKLTQLVPGLDDVTLLVQAGVKTETFVGAVNTMSLGKTVFWFALFDGPEGELKDTAAVTALRTKNTYPQTAHGAVYYPWLTADWAVQKDGNTNDGGTPKYLSIPPSAAVAGAYCTVDRERGVWKAPANVPVKGGARPRFKVSDDVDGACNVPASGGAAINVIREFRGTGPLIWGARTLNANSDDWRFVPVRRLFSAAEKDIRSAMGVALFEPNSAPTWERVRSAIDIYLHGLWKAGALMGDTPEQAYFVRIGLGVTMTASDIENGQMIVKVGMAAVRPAEFIILELTQDVVPA
ncbi:phage tail sheath family protein [Paraburkholderia aspalathi]|uniref:phage tail sheath family protein n=1 Tax=Paraburkholderia aspalathi TaxID=1324617 RepID=UPI0038BA61EB